MNIIYKSPFDKQCKVVSAKTKKISIEELKQLILLKEQLSHVNIDFNIIFNGKKITDNLFIDNFNIFIQISIPLNGGKGGFGSMLRAIGAQIEKTTNREACRDLSGRRLRDVNEEKRLKEWIKKQSDRKDEEKRKKEKLKRIAEGKLTANCQYNDSDFEKFRNEIPDIVEDSINQGLQQDSKNKKSDSNEKTADLKRKSMENDSSNSGSGSNDEDLNKPSCSKTIPTATSSISNNNSNKKIKKHNLWLGIDADSDSDSDSDSDIEPEKEEKQSKALN